MRVCADSFLVSSQFGDFVSLMLRAFLLFRAASPGKEGSDVLLDL